MSKMGRFGEVREQALAGRDEGMAEEIDALRGAPLQRRVEFLREVPGAKGAVVDDLLADIRALQEGKGGLAPAVFPETAPAKRGGRRGGGLMLGLLLGLLLGVGMGGVGTWMALPQAAPAAAPMVAETPVPAPAPVSRWASSEEEDLYLALSRANGGLALAGHCRGDGKVEVEVAGGRRAACLAWPPAE